MTPIQHIEIEVGKRYMTRSGDIAAVLGKNVKADPTTYWGAIAGVGMATWYVNGLCIQNITHDLTHLATEEDLEKGTQEKIAFDMKEKQSMDERVKQLEDWRKEPDSFTERAIIPLLSLIVALITANIILSFILLSNHIK
jgi:hypothetical protein